MEIAARAPEPPRRGLSVLTSADPSNIKEVTPWPNATVANQKAILKNQAAILANQKAILANQGKLDRVLANQKKIEANQARILANQKKILGR